MTASSGDTSSLFLLGGSADIGRALAERYAADGWHVTATFRSTDPSKERQNSGITWLQCDVSDPSSVSEAISCYAESGRRWKLFLSSVGTLDPIGPFFSISFDAWQDSVIVNSLAQLRVLHALYGRRAENASVGLFAGGGTNNPFNRYSAYCLAKIMLIKMCELLDDEAEDLNAFIVGPGFVDTRIHDQTLLAGERAGENYDKTQRFLERREEGASADEIYACINWCVEQGRSAIGGRNLSLVHDAWRDGGEELAARLRHDRNLLKLRRYEPRQR